MTNESVSGLQKEIGDLKNEIKKLKNRKKYGLVWEHKTEQVIESCKEKLPVLSEDNGKEFKTEKNKSTSIIIEGDNYQSLSVLNYTHAGKIDVVYIDPPYNTGAKDWKYNNDYVDINDTYRHSKWLSMMSKRLQLAKNLLKKDGALICAIDENEVSHLGVILEDIFFGWEIHLITIVHNPRGIQGKNFSYTNEFAFFVLPSGKKIIGSRKIKEEDIEWRNLRDNGGESLRSDARNCFYPMIVKDGVVIGFGDVLDNNKHPKKQTENKDGLSYIWPIDSKGIERKWRYARQSVDSIKHLLRAKVKKDGYEIEIGKDFGTVRTVWEGSRYDANENGTKLIHALVPNTDFDFPKSIYNVYDCLAPIIYERKNAIVLDYFAGSGTTGHAVMMLNKEDKGNRKFILCTNNENGIAEDVCYPRIKKVIQGHKDYPAITNIPTNLKYFRTDFVEAKPTDINKKKLVDKSTEMLCLKEDCFELVKKGLNFKIFTDNKNKYLGIIYDDTGIELFKKEAQKLNEKIITYIFSLDDSAREEEFEDIKKLVELKPIPAVILNVYKKIFK
ncbi:MAG: site-specific DNA-methyltransferase [bacterium]